MKIVLRSVVLSCLLSLSVPSGAASLLVSVQDGNGKPLVDAIVYAVPESGAPVPKLEKPAEIEQRGLRFAPLVSVVQTGSKIAFPNNDRVRHHIYSFSPAKKFDQKLYSGAMAASQVFDKAGTVVLGCNIHDSMIAYVKVVDTPYFAKSDAAGVARIELPAGVKYAVTAWHFNMVASAGIEQSVAPQAGETPTAVTFKLAMKAPLAESAPAPAYAR
jgi:plastocyanin